VRVAGSLALILTGLVLGSAAWARPNAGARLYVRPMPVVFALSFNPHSPLFDGNPDLARAINFALDRPALIRAWGPYAGHPTARLLPAGSPGYGTRSPYPLDGPHLDTARLLAADNLRSGKATLLVNSGFQGVGEEVEAELARIGLDVTVAVSIRFASPTPDLELTGWRADYPDPAATFAYIALAPSFSAELAHARSAAGSKRARSFAQLDEDVMTQVPPAAPFMAANARLLVSARTHCFQWNLYYGVDLAALCVR
jgi:ABC-type transport system substrate-binding protein